MVNINQSINQFSRGSFKRPIYLELLQVRPVSKSKLIVSELVQARQTPFLSPI